ncbi:MAG TPA: prephenate dehydrogenase [Nitrospirales bacterium]|nr:prephenate dehydrogenase [Nitrospirales bacterium]HIB53716.1 prephenate dehydrogenase [Nitrospirales bacterium]HIC04211.1 prephenate dehydrogenase [Nitrospirales bacterium]HIN33539.1 prephenate dehydrogenase [Nitrospirales bacterium]HIO21937.1 prephenate dehydrogenase [Nitrospirales bacterium]
MRPHFPQVTIVGTGFIGGSIGLATKSAGLADVVVGTDVDQDAINQALAARAIDQGHTDLLRAVKGSSLVILASPVGTFEEIIRSTVHVLERETILSDVGSVKGQMVMNIDALLPPHLYFVGAHPIAGSEKSNALSSYSDLFNGKPCVVTPTSETNATALSVIRSFWESIGTTVTTMDPLLHDKFFGAVSHLPHMIAYATLNSITRIRDALFPDANLHTLSPSSLKDMTRIASSSPSLWSEICCQNAGNLVTMLETYQDEISELTSLVRQGDRHGLQHAFAQAKNLRDQLC